MIYLFVWFDLGWFWLGEFVMNIINEFNDKEIVFFKDCYFW